MINLLLFCSLPIVKNVPKRVKILFFRIARVICLLILSKVAFALGLLFMDELSSRSISSFVFVGRGSPSCAFWRFCVLSSFSIRRGRGAACRYFRKRDKARKRWAGSLKTFSMDGIDWMKSASELESWIGFEPISLCDFPFSRSWWEDPAAPNLGTPLTFRRDISLHLISNIPQNSVFWLDPSKEKRPKTNRRISIPEIW